MLSSLAYPTAPPPVYHNIALMRMMGTVYFTMFHDKPIYLKLECVTILLEVIRDALYIRYIIQDYTYIFGVFDIISNLLFCVVIGLSIENGDGQWSKISERFEGIRKTCVGCCWWGPSPPPPLPPQRPSPAFNNGHLYTSLSNNDTDTETADPVYTFGGRQAFKPSFYSSSWGHEYLNTKVAREFDRIDVGCDRGSEHIGMISRTDGATEYIRFDDAEAAAAGGSASASAAANHYANIFVSPYFAKDGTRVTSLSGWTKVDSVGVCLFIYNLIQFIYQLLIYHSIVTSCRAVHADSDERMVRWLC